MKNHRRRGRFPPERDVAVRTGATTEEIAAWIEDQADNPEFEGRGLTWDDVEEIEPGRWLPTIDAYEKFEFLRSIYLKRLEENDVEVEALLAEQADIRRRLSETWMPCNLITETGPWSGRLNDADVDDDTPVSWEFPPR